MAKTLTQILGFENLTGVVMSPKGGVPEDILPAGFLTTTRGVEGHTGTWTITAGQRQTAKRINYGAPSEAVAHQARSTQASVLLHTYEHIRHQASLLNQLRDFGNTARQARGIQEIDTQTAQFRQRLNNLRVSSVWSVLRHGAVYFDGQGNLLPTSSGAVVTVDFQVPANNKNQLNGIIGASWGVAGTDIIGDVEALKIVARKTTGKPATEAYYGTSILKYLVANTQIKELLKADVGLASAFRQRMIPDGFLGLNWHPAYEAFFEDADGTNQSWFGDDRITFTPAVDRTWYEMLEGTFEVPTNLGNVVADSVDALGQFATVQGMFSYAVIDDDPPGIKHYHGDTFLPTLTDPGAVFIADVTP